MNMHNSDNGGSYTPDMASACDSMIDTLAEPFLRDTPLPKSQIYALISEGLDSARIDSRDDRGEGIIAALQMVAKDENRALAMRATCYLRLLGYERRSFEEIGKEFHVTRATVHIIYRKIQDQHGGIRSRGDKRDEAREGCRERSRKRKITNQKQNTQWKYLPT